jgi:transposase InsO family protein
VSERDLAKRAAKRLAILRHAEEVSGSVAKTCRYYGVSRSCFYKWLERYRELGVDGLRDRSKKPLNCPFAIQDEVIGKIIYLRQHYHFGPLKIVMYLKRYHDITVSNSGVWRVLRRLGMNRLPAYRRYTRHTERWKLYEQPQPGHRVQVDVKFISPLKGSQKRHYQYTAVDDCTRLRVLHLYTRANQKASIQFIDYVLQRLPFRVEVIQTDNGAEFQAAFHWHVTDRGIRHVYIKPATPRLNGKVERSHRIDDEEFYRQLNGVVVDNTELFNQRLQEWEHFYNFDRPHGGLGGQTPYERLRERTNAPSVPDLRQMNIGGRVGV